MVLDNYEVITFNEKKYVSPRTFAAIFSMDRNTVYQLLRHGNKLRRLLSIRRGDEILIPSSEVFNYPFFAKGRFNKELPRHMNRDGEMEHFTANEYKKVLEFANKVNAETAQIKAHIVNESLLSIDGYVEEEVAQ